MQYDIFVQDKLFKTITTDGGYNLRSVAVEIEDAIASGDLVVDRTKPVGIRVVPR